MQELKALCEATHLPCPPVDALVATVHNSPAVADVLGKVLHAMGEVAAAKEKRAPLVAQVLELEEALGEACWLREYNQDEDRYV